MKVERLKASCYSSENFLPRMGLKQISKWAATSVQSQICPIGLKALVHSFWILISINDFDKLPSKFDQCVFICFYLKKFENHPFWQDVPSALCVITVVPHFSMEGEQKNHKVPPPHTCLLFVTVYIAQWQLCFNVRSKVVHNSLTIAFARIKWFPVSEQTHAEPPGLN